jgi:hypothetical protein
MTAYYGFRRVYTRSYNFEFGGPTRLRCLGCSISHFSLSSLAFSDFLVNASYNFGHPPPSVRMSTARPVLTSMYVTEPLTSATIACCVSEKSEVVPLLRVGSISSCLYAAISYL